MSERKRRSLQGLVLLIPLLLAVLFFASRKAGAGAALQGVSDVEVRNCDAPAPQVSVNPTTVNIGQSAVVTWSSPAGIVVGGNLGSSRSGSRTVTPSNCEPARYYITLKGECDGSEPITGEATLNVTSPPPDPWVSASPGWIHAGYSATIRWGASTGQRVAGNVGSGLSGSQAVSPGQGNHSYWQRVAATCNASNTRDGSASLTVGPPPDDDDDDGGMDCFATGTKITLADGSTKNVEDLKVGDTVRSFDVKTGQFVSVAVTETSSKKEGGDYVKINGGSGVTLDHRFYSNGQFIKAGDLKVGDELIDEKGNVIKIASVVHKPGPVWVHPIRVQDPPATFIAEGIVVHNQSAGSTAKDEGLVTGTRITMANGKKLPIEKVTAGELILSVDPNTGMLMRYKVLAAGKPQQASKYTIINGKLRMGGGNQVFKSKLKKKAPPAATPKKKR